MTSATAVPATAGVREHLRHPQPRGGLAAPPARARLVAAEGLGGLVRRRRGGSGRGGRAAAGAGSGRLAPARRRPLAGDGGLARRARRGLVDDGALRGRVGAGLAGAARLPPAAASTANTVMPTDSTAPWRMRVGPSMRVPSTRVPLREPRSSTSSPPSLGRTATWRRESSASSISTSTFSRPMTSSRDTSIRRPSCWAEVMTRVAMRHPNPIARPRSTCRRTRSRWAGGPRAPWRARPARAR